MPFFTIIIPTYNRKNIIGRAIESVINQGFEDWELLIIDDGSTDETGSYISSTFQDPRIKYFYKIHEERSAARNYGIDQSKGKYICFLDSDDEYLPCFLQLHYGAIQKFPEFKMFRVGALLEKNENREVLAISRNEFLNLEYICLQMNGLPSYSINIELLHENKFDPMFYIGEDLHLLARIILNNSASNIYKVGVVYHYNPASELLRTKSIDQIINRLQCHVNLMDNLLFKSPKNKRLVTIKFLETYLMGINIFIKSFNLKLLNQLVAYFGRVLLNPILFIKAWRKLVS